MPLNFACSKYRVTSTPTYPAAMREGDKFILNYREETMKIRLLLALAGLAISFALPTSAQEQSAVDPKARQEIEAALMKYNEAWNKGDAGCFRSKFHGRCD